MAAFSGPNQVKIRSDSGPNQVWGEGFRGGRVQRGRSGWEGSVAPPESLDTTLPDMNYRMENQHGELFEIRRCSACPENFLCPENFNEVL